MVRKLILILLCLVVLSSVAYSARNALEPLNMLINPNGICYLNQNNTFTGDNIFTGNTTIYNLTIVNITGVNFVNNSNTSNYATSSGSSLLSNYSNYSGSSIYAVNATYSNRSGSSTYATNATYANTSGSSTYATNSTFSNKTGSTNCTGNTLLLGNGTCVSFPSEVQTLQNVTDLGNTTTQIITAPQYTFLPTRSYINSTSDGTIIYVGIV